MTNASIVSGLADLSEATYVATMQYRRWVYKLWAMDSMLDGESILRRDLAVPRQPAQGELDRQAQALISAMASFGADQQGV